MLLLAHRAVCVDFFFSFFGKPPLFFLLTRLIFLQVYSLFLDALCDFIVVNKVDLHDWLFVLLSRLLTKLGTDLLSSLQSKVVRVLDVIR